LLIEEASIPVKSVTYKVIISSSNTNYLFIIHLTFCFFSKTLLCSRMGCQASHQGVKPQLPTKFIKEIAKDVQLDFMKLGLVRDASTAQILQ